MITVSSCRPPLAGWIGGKNLLAKQIIARIPEHTCYVEPFCGAAWVLFQKPPSKVEILNDINGDIITLYRVIKAHPEELTRQFELSLISRDEFERVKSIPPETLTDIQRAARFLYLQQNCFGGRMHNATVAFSHSRAPKLNLPKLEKYLSDAHRRLSRVYIECLPYDKVISRYDRPETFFYLDPPYWGCESYYGTNIFTKEDFFHLSALLAGIKGKFLLSLNDTPEVRDIFSNFQIEEVMTSYSCSRSLRMPAKEVFIYR